jgi:predicted RNA-binding protein associated with RNAse of E/G family
VSEPRHISEVKNRLHGDPKVFEVEELLREDGFMLVRFVTTAAFKVDTNVIHAGSYTYGYFWEDRNYNIYRMHLADGTLFAYRFDILRDVRLLEDRLEWTDLLLDEWVYLDGHVEWKDEDQVRRFREAGWMSEEDEALVQRTRQELEARLPDILQEADEILARAEEMASR